MYKEHPSFDPPPDDAVLWRYMDFTKFVSLLDRSALFFVRADKLNDPFEGAWPDSNIMANKAFYATFPKKALRRRMNTPLEIRRFTLVSCWHENPYESAAMWSLYSKEKDGKDGIAVKTNFSSFKQSFISETDIFVGRVSYIDYAIGSIPGGILLNPFLYKRHSFEHEREVRAINLALSQSEKGFCQDVCDTGIYFEVDLSPLIKEVIVAPTAEDWFFQLVRSVVTRYDMKAPVNKSKLTDEPNWDPGYPV